MNVDPTQFELLRVEEARPQVALVTLDRPERLNALSWALVDELHAALRRDRRRQLAAGGGADR